MDSRQHNTPKEPEIELFVKVGLRGGSDSLAHLTKVQLGAGVFMFCEAGDGYPFQCHSPQGLAKWLPKQGDPTVVWGLWGLWGVTLSSLRDALVL